MFCKKNLDKRLNVSFETSGLLIVSFLVETYYKNARHDLEVVVVVLHQEEVSSEAAAEMWSRCGGRR